MAVSGFRLRARLDFSIPSCSPGQRGITPAFGYSAPHPSAEGTSTPMIHALPSAHYEDATTSRLRVPVSLWFRSQVPRTPRIVRVRRGAPDACGGHSSGLGRLISRCPVCRRYPFVDASGISQVAWRSIPCLCPAPRPRPGRRALACSGLADAAPGSDTPKAPAGSQSRGLAQGFSIRCLRFTNSVATAHARLASGWRAAPLPGGCRTLWIALRGFGLHPSSFPGLCLTQTGREMTNANFASASELRWDFMFHVTGGARCGELCQYHLTRANTRAALSFPTMGSD